ncbi:hypothetical protein GUJ93_ZPchr0004g38660 [Zizania palustris]|uniref:Uncharacterized protein n=1 Tax=Zizania palustris TaxID=103762 RepID=A0A8J5T050_ZIZPA|nr:hypothetical protein GUJ93_ZPchr0004g38660 [Zizania palustris]
MEKLSSAKGKEVSEKNKRNRGKNAGLETPGTKSAASSTREAQLREQLQTEKQHADLLQQELNTLKKKVEETEESMAKTQEDVLRTQKQMKKFKKRQEASDLML